LQRRLVECWHEVEEDDGAGAVVLTGAGRAFCAGGDVALLQEVAGGNGPVREELSRLHRALFTRNCSPFPCRFVAAVHGPAVGFGASWSLSATSWSWAATAFLSDPHVRLGFAGIARLPAGVAAADLRARSPRASAVGRRVGAWRRSVSAWSTG